MVCNGRCFRTKEDRHRPSLLAPNDLHGIIANGGHHGAESADCGATGVCANGISRRLTITA